MDSGGFRSLWIRRQEIFHYKTCAGKRICVWSNPFLAFGYAKCLSNEIVAILVPSILARKIVFNYLVLVVSKGSVFSTDQLVMQMLAH